jgi:hypothetical protein
VIALKNRVRCPVACQFSCNRQNDSAARAREFDAARHGNRQTGPLRAAKEKRERNPKQNRETLDGPATGPFGSIPGKHPGKQTETLDGPATGLETQKNQDQINTQTTKEKTMKTGRPPKHPDDRYRTPARQIGRVSDDDWNTILRAVEATGQTKTEWATHVLLKAAERVLRGDKKT